MPDDDRMPDYGDRMPDYGLKMRLLSARTLQTLKELARERGLPVSGLKADVMHRIAIAPAGWVPRSTVLEMFELQGRGQAPRLVLQHLMSDEAAAAWLAAARPTDSTARG